MLKLIALEIQKYKLKSYLKGIAISNLAIIGLVSMIYFIEKNEGVDIFNSFESVLSFIEVMVRVTFTIFAAVLIVRLFIDEYKNKTISILFTYPIQRKRIMLAKVLIILTFTFFSVLGSILFLDALLYGAASIYPLFPEGWNSIEWGKQFLTIILGTLATSGISLIPIYFGMRKYSATATFVSAILLASLLNSTNGGYTMFSIIAVPLALGAVGLYIAFMAIRKIEQMDVN